ncbi:hypothetical protein [Streptosporangium sp. NPDC004631]
MTIALENLAPYPDRAENVTAEALAKHFATFAQLHFRLNLDDPDRDKAMDSSRAFVSYYAVAFLLREIEAAGVGVADRVAKTLWEAWQHPQTLGPDVWAWLEEYGITPEAVNRIASNAVSERRALRKRAAEAERDRLRHALERAAQAVAHDYDSAACRERPAYQERLKPCQQRPPEHDEDCPACDLQTALDPAPDDYGCDRHNASVENDRD